MAMRQTQEALRWLVVLTLVFMLFIDVSRAAPQLDTTFGENGFVVKDFGNGDDEILALAAQTDGKIIVVGHYNNGAVKNLAVARYLPTGELDRTFNDDGLFTHSMGSGDTVGRSLAIQSDGKIVVAGSADDSGHNIALIRLTKDGFQDNSFADNGQVLLPIADGEVNAYAVQMTPEGAILVAGTVNTSADTGTYGIVVKLTAAGQKDASFGDLGVSLVKYDYNVEIRSIALQTDGKIVTAGSFATSGTAQAGLLRLDQNGAVDEPFGERGQVIVSLEGSGSIINDVKLDSAGRLVVAGDVNNGSNLQTFVGRLKADGTIDSAFAASGIYRNDSNAENVGQALSPQVDGIILVAGFVATAKGKDAYVLTLEEKTASSTSDKISATYITADLAETDDIGNALAISPDGFVFVAGSTVVNGKKDFALLRFIGGQTLEDTLASGTGSTGEGVSTAGYTIVTKAVTSITRVGAFSGGIISEDGNNSCADSCVATCSATTSTTSNTTTPSTTPSTTTPSTSSSSSTSCYDSCFASCKLPTITLRGVVYGIKSNPVYDDNADQDSSTSTTISSTNTTNSTTNTTNTANTTNTTTSGTGTTSTTVSIFPASDTFVYSIVKKGQTEDGSGTGSYDSDIQKITPNTFYYLRAYAVLSDDTVIYGNEVTFKTDDACFIATAAFGSILDKHVTLLREFRDKVMMANEIGQRLVGTYYSISPTLAGFVADHEALRYIVRVILIPFVLLAYFVLKIGAVAKVCLLLASIGAVVVISRKTQKPQVTSV
jgi:uncharacterized delta-60 repeat protein